MKLFDKNFKAQASPIFLKYQQNIPLKLKLFIRLYLGNTILTWDNQHKCGFTGECICPLCKSKE